MIISGSLEAFSAFLTARAVQIHGARARDGIAAMLAFYGDVRASDVDVNNDGDMLLFQYGTYDWGKGLRFEVDITRQLSMRGGEDEDLWQLRLTYRFEPGANLRALGAANKWCMRPGELGAFQPFVEQHPVLVVVGDRCDGDVALRLECAG